MRHRSRQPKIKKTVSPVWVTHHAVKRFKRRVNSLSIAECRREIRRMLSQSTEVTADVAALAKLERIHKKPNVRYFRANVGDSCFILVVCDGEQSEHCVLTVLLDADMFYSKSGGKRYGDRIAREYRCDRETA